jgi:exopolyphosphatase/guanosine-5'-triphosphate,3'-diphosphate pyrophosphatase
MSQAQNPIAAIDIGTNSAHLVIAKMDKQSGLRVLDTDKVSLRLGQAVDSAGNITADGIFRTVEAVNHMKELTKSYNASIRAVATHATREAHNYRELLDSVRAETGIEVEVIDGVEEARLVFLGMGFGLPIGGKSCLGVDIGGGSTEIVVGKDNDISYLSSAKLGAVTLTAKYLDPKNPKGKQIEELANHVRSRFAPYVPELKSLEFETAIISSGTAKALASINARLLDTESITDPNGYTISQEELFRIYKKLI